MSRYIDADATLNIIKKYLYETALNNFTADRKFADACEEIAEHRLATWIDAVPTADVPQWIPCSERLPYSQEDVLCDDDGRVTIGYYTDEEVGWHDTHSYRIYPTVWMPLPEPWKGEEDDKRRSD